MNQINQKNQQNQKNQFKWVDHGNYYEFTAPQGDPSWLEVRLGRITTSVSGAMAHRSKFKTAVEQGEIIAGIKEEDFTEEELELMGHGNEKEPEARQWCINYIKRKVVERGLIVPKWDVTLGASVDGDIVGTDGIIEIKCPKWMYGPLLQYMNQKTIGKWTPPTNYFKHIWSTHIAQMQHAMAVMGKKWCIYIVYSTSDRQIFTQVIPFDEQYWNNHYQIIKQSYSNHVTPHLDGTYPIMPY